MSEIILKINRPTLRVVLNGTVPITGGGGGGTITVKESDGSPSVSADTLIMPNGTVTDSGSGDATFNPSGRYAVETSLDDGDYLFGQVGSVDSKWTRKTLKKAIAGNFDFISSYLDVLNDAGFELSNQSFDRFFWQATGGGTPTTNLFSGTTGVLGDGSNMVYGVRNTYTATTAAGTGSVAKGKNGGNIFLYRGNAAGLTGFICIDFFSINGTNWDNTGASTGARVYSGLSTTNSATTNGASDNPATQRAMFVRSHVNGGLTETNWFFSVKDATTENRIDTGLAFTANGNQYCSIIACNPQGGEIYYRLKNLTTGGDTGLGSVSSNIPTSTTGLLHITGFYNVDAVSRSIGWKKCNIYQKQLL